LVSDLDKSIELRRARVVDLKDVANVWTKAIDNLDKKHGFFEEPTPSSLSENPHFAFWLTKNPASFWVAEDKNQIVGYSYSFLRGSLWFLADLFILPSYQGKGLGRNLIEKTLKSWNGHRITNHTLITPAFNRSSVSLYMRFGMLPRQPIYFAEAPKKAVLQNRVSKNLSTLETEEITNIERVSSKLDRLHKIALGFPAGWHNEFFSKYFHSRCLLFFKKNGGLEGYAHFRSNGRVGPLVVKSPSSLRPALEATLDIAAKESDVNELTIFFAGTNREAVRVSIEYGFKITYPTLLLSSKSLGDWSNYLFYSPGLM
jgi:ribosomal protein S18 acetylase RimI-like enzyme